MQAQIYTQALKMVLLPCYIMHYCTYITLYVLEHADVLTHDALCPMKRKKEEEKTCLKKEEVNISCSVNYGGYQNI